MSLKYAVLGFLYEDAHHGYELKQRIEENFGEACTISYGQLYPTLHKLDDTGYVRKKRESGKRALDKNVYIITEKGRRAFREWFENSPKKNQFSIKDEFTFFLLFLGKIKPDKTCEIIKKQLSQVITRCDRYREKLRRLKKERRNSYRVYLITKMVYHLEAEIKWLNDLIASYSEHTQR